MIRENMIEKMDSTKFSSIVKLVSMSLNMSESTIFSGARDLQIMMSRKLLIYALDDMCWGCSRIAKHMNINHATILHHLKIKDSDLNSLPKLRKKYEELSQSVRLLKDNSFQGSNNLERIQNMLLEYRKLKEQSLILNRKTDKLLDDIEVEITTSYLNNSIN